MPIEIAARTRIAIRIGITGEDEPPPLDEAVPLAGLALVEEDLDCLPPPFACCCLVEPLPGLLWLTPVPPPVLGLLFADDDGLLDEDPDPVCGLPELVAVGLPADLAGGLLEWVGVPECPPVIVGTAVSY